MVVEVVAVPVVGEAGVTLVVQLVRVPTASSPAKAKKTFNLVFMVCLGWERGDLS